MAEQWERAASAAGSFTRANAATIFVMAVPLVTVSLTVGMTVWLVHNFLTVGSGR